MSDTDDAAVPPPPATSRTRRAARPPAVLVPSRWGIEAIEQKLPFYPAWSLRLSTRRRPRLVSEDQEVVLDRTNAPLYELNDRGELRLTSDTVVYYVRFFFDFVGRAHRKFLIVEPGDTVPWSGEPSAALRGEFEQVLMPLTYLGMNGNFMMLLRATVLFRDGLFRTDIVVAPLPLTIAGDAQHPLVVYTTGQLELCDEELLMESLPVVLA